MKMVLILILCVSKINNLFKKNNLKNETVKRIYTAPFVSHMKHKYKSLNKNLLYIELWQS